MTDTNTNTGGDTGAGTGSAAPWYDTLDTETKGYLQNKGLDKKTAVEAFAEVSKFHREAEKFVGAPPSELVRIPKDPNAPEWKNIYERLGKPKEAKEYDFTTVKRAGDKPLDQALTDTLRQTAFDANLSKEAAARLAANVAKHLDGVDSANTAIAADKLAVEKAELNKNWGTNAAANMVVAQAAAKVLGMAEAVNALEGTAGYAKVLEMFRTIGVKMGEDKFVSAGGAGGSGPMTRDQAVAEKAELMRDTSWTKRYTSGGVEENRKMLALNRIITNTSV